MLNSPADVSPDLISQSTVPKKNVNHSDSLLLAVVPHYSPALSIVAGEISQKSAITLCIPDVYIFMILVPR